MDRKQLAKYVLIGSLVFVFGWFGIDKLRDPLFWSAYLPVWMDGLFQVSNDSWIIVVGFIELLLAALLLIPFRRVRQIAATLMILHLVGILFQVGFDDIGVRDVGLLLSGVALMLLL